MLELAAEHGGRPDDPSKRDPLDFVLWQPSLEDEPAWESRWGPGRPGWHIECSALALRELGVTLDVHGGGRDLAYPHHECEAAQSETVTGEPFVKHWMHVGLVGLDGVKMSKSLGNLVFVHDLVSRSEPAAVRLSLLDQHYREDWEWRDEMLSRAQSRLATWRSSLTGRTFERARRRARRAGRRPRHARRACARSTPRLTRGPTSPRPPRCSALRCSERKVVMSEITVELPDGSARTLEEGATALDLAAAIGKRLAKDALAARVNGSLTDLSAPLADGDKVAIVTPASDDGREVLRHSRAHVMAQAVTRLWPGAHYAIGPAIRDGFYYDFELPGGEHFSDDDLARGRRRDAGDHRRGPALHAP